MVKIISREGSKKGLKKCSCCDEFPMPVCGESVDNNPIFAMACKNELCPGQPSTSGYSSMDDAIGAWNRGTVTNSLFLKSENSSKPISLIKENKHDNVTERSSNRFSRENIGKENIRTKQRGNYENVKYA
jgi:hypothetical protein